MTFVDTNYFLRYLLNDISQQHQEAKKLFVAGFEGDVKLQTSSIVIFEIAWVLRSFYSVSKAGVIEALQKVLQFSFLDLPERTILKDALTLFEKTNLDLEDCYNLFYAKAEGIKEFKTFDKKLTKAFDKETV